VVQICLLIQFEEMLLCWKQLFSVLLQFRLHEERLLLILFEHILRYIECLRSVIYLALVVFLLLLHSRNFYSA